MGTAKKIKLVCDTSETREKFVRPALNEIRFSTRFLN